MTARVAIAGAGMAGSYLYRLLQRSGIAADVYGDENGHGACGLRPCGWGTTSEFPDLVKSVGLDPSDYVLRELRTVDFDGTVMSVKLMTFDKPRLIRDLLAGASVINGKVPTGKYERVIDATGLARAYLPPVQDQLIIPCVQYRVRNPERDSDKVTIRYGNIGYSWIFPLGRGEFHIGAGSLLEDPRAILKETGFPQTGDSAMCECSGSARLSSPDRCLPLVARNPGLQIPVWGVGESIGAVCPVSGEGVAPGMTSANVLLKNWEDPEKYTSRILKTFSYMAGERRVIDKVWARQRLAISDWMVLRGSGKRMGSDLRLSEVRALLKCLNRYAAEEDHRADAEPHANDERALLTNEVSR